MCRPRIVFIDAEVAVETRRVFDIGAVDGDGRELHSSVPEQLTEFLKGADFIGGHNVLGFDWKFLDGVLSASGMADEHTVDTLFWSPLLFPQRPYHRLLKDEKLQQEELNNPLSDAKKARALFDDEVEAFQACPPEWKRILFGLLGRQREFGAFFRCASFSESPGDVVAAIQELFQEQVCAHALLALMVEKRPVELAYCLSLIRVSDRYSIMPPWVVKQFPRVERVYHALRNMPCATGCTYCRRQLNVREGLRRFFGFESFRTYAGEPLQEEAAQAAVDGRSLLAVFPTGGGKSVTFQVPALMSGENEKGLTVVISPLQSLMKDQVDNLLDAGITEAVAINGLLDPVERAKAIEQVADGVASLLYISPESLRSRTIEKLLTERNVVRFVIDEAHCFSSWGQDFRPDYLYIGDFIKTLQERKRRPATIPVSCFTATAKQQVIADISAYFRDKLGLELALFEAKSTRENLHYFVKACETDIEKYQTLRNLLDEARHPAIVYVSRTHRARDLAKRLEDDGYSARAFHGKMDQAEKVANQNAFMAGDVRIIVATSAFGMGVDKKDVGLIVHYEIPDSLENYVQEAGRAGRDQTIEANCHILFNEEDLDKHFILLNQTKLSIKEIGQVWNAVKRLCHIRATIQNSALEIARAAGWDDMTNPDEMETRVKTALTALEECGYLKRGQNAPRIYANSILCRSMMEAGKIIEQSTRFANDAQKNNARRIMSKLFGQRSRSRAAGDADAESRVDYIADHLGLVRGDVIQIINILRDEKILADHQDLSAYIRTGKASTKSIRCVKTYIQLEIFLLSIFRAAVGQDIFHIKELNGRAVKAGLSDCMPEHIRRLLNYWCAKGIGKIRHKGKDHFAFMLQPASDSLENSVSRRHDMALWVVAHLHKAASLMPSTGEEQTVEFSVAGLCQQYSAEHLGLGAPPTFRDMEDVLFYLLRIGAIRIEGGFLVVYNKLRIERIEKNNNKRYTKQDYRKLEEFYGHRIQQIHIVGEYAKKMIGARESAIQFVEDYFRRQFKVFLTTYFTNARRVELQRNITAKKYNELFASLSPSQRRIIDDHETLRMVVAAGPGSGKTKLLVHKLAALVLMEDVKHEQLLMLTFSRAAVTEFKKRLLALIGNAAHFIDIKTFHSYCFDLLGRVGSLDASEAVIPAAIGKIKSGEIEPGRITKTVLVIDEAQDMDADGFALVESLMTYNEGMRVIAVGDDDQNIYEWRKSSSAYMRRLLDYPGARKYELPENWRSCANVVDFSNQFATRIRSRLKDIPVSAVRPRNGLIKVVRHHGKGSLIVPLVQDVNATRHQGSTAVLTLKNDEAEQVVGALSRSGCPATLIQNNDDFRLADVAEVRALLERFPPDSRVLNDATCDEALRAVRREFKGGRGLELCERLFADFRATYPAVKYRNDLHLYIHESRSEDFVRTDNTGHVCVSTIHKAKGREFDSVFLLLDHPPNRTDAARRTIYVGLTRAKSMLSIHAHSDLFDWMRDSATEWMDDTTDYPPPPEVKLFPSLRDVNLGYAAYAAARVEALPFDAWVRPTMAGCENAEGKKLLEYAARFRECLKEWAARGYTPTAAAINYRVYWTNKETGEEHLILLPEINLTRQPAPGVK